MTLHHIAVLCSDKATALPFYEALGFEAVRSVARPEQHDEIFWLRGHGVTLELFIDATHPPHVSSPEAYGLRHIAIATEDAAAVRASLVEAGFSPEPLRTDPFDGRAMFFIKDPDGLPIEFHE